jgi:hypothetical protein
VKVLKKSNNTRKNSCLFLWLDASQFHAKEASKRGVDVSNVFIEYKSVLIRAIRRAHLSLTSLAVSYWLADWKSQINKYSTIIIHASKLSPPIVAYIRKNSPTIRIIVWYWNPVLKCVLPHRYAGNDCEIWSFDEADCTKYSMHHNNQYYFKKLKGFNNSERYDLVFVGSDKGRAEDIFSLSQRFATLGLKCYFHVVPSAPSKKAKPTFQARISYRNILDLISQSKAILDYVSQGQHGLTLRPLEALFFKKKLITNDKSIISRDFYNKKNVFVLGCDNLSYLQEFINSPYIETEEYLVEKYSFEQWIKRFNI